MMEVRLDGRPPTAVTHLAPTLEQCLGRRGVHVIDCPIDYRENERVFYQELKKKTSIV